MRKIVIVGSGLGGLSTALRLSNYSFDITVIDKHSTPGGRLNQLNLNGYKFDIGPSFMSMTYELEELLQSTGVENTLKLRPLDPLYSVYFEWHKRPFRIYKDLKKLQKEFEGIESNLEEKVNRFLSKAGQFFHDTENKVVRSNFNNKFDYLLKLSKVPKKHIPYLFKSVWSEVTKTFDSQELRIIFSLVAFFLGSTPFKTPAIYTLLNYTEMRHNGYWNIEGGMYKLVEFLITELKKRNVKFLFNTEIVDFNSSNSKIKSLIDSNKNEYFADYFIINSDAAFFRGKVLNNKRFSERQLDKMDWTMAPFTIYLGLKTKLPNLEHHNYFLGSNFEGYANKIFTSSVSPQKPYYYVNVLSRSNPECAPEFGESVFILCPVPDLRFKPDWSDREELAQSIIQDLSRRTETELEKFIDVKVIYDPIDWQNMFNLYKGSGLGLAHGINQVGALRPANKDEIYNNVYYVGASTIPGTGLPMVIISSKLVVERMIKDGIIR